MPLRPPLLSKSRVQSGAQCHLKLWYDCFDRNLAPPVDAVQQFIFDRGTRIGLLAQGRYPGGTEIDAKHFETKLALEQTRAALLDPDTSALFEPAFVHKGVLARVDVLRRTSDDRWDLIEVKGATRRKDVYLRDLAIQLWILRGAGIKVARAGLLLLNRRYTYDGEQLDLSKLFKFADLTENAEAMHGEIEELVASLQESLDHPMPPPIAPGEQCHFPYKCRYYAHCTRDTVFPEHPVGDLPRIHPDKVRELAEIGVLEIGAIPDHYSLNETQARVRDTVIAGEDWVSDDLGEALGDISYPVHHLDFETLMPGVPIYPGTRPFEAVAFQYSIHRENEDGTVEHFEYLYTSAADPRRDLAERLLADLGERGSICVYSSYETSVINNLARHLPDLLAPLKALVPRIWDLLPIVRTHYYHPGFRGSFSIKSVLPVLVPELSYDQMEIGDGMAAAILYEMARTSEDEDARKKIYDDLRLYCGRDSEAMLELRRALGKRAN
jgi:hypothetical protein